MFVPLSRHLPSSSPPHQLIFYCSSHSSDTCPHPVLYISRSSAVRPTLQTLALIQLCTSADLLLFVPLSRHLPSSSPLHQPIFCCSSDSPDTCPHPVLHILLPGSLLPCCFFGLSLFLLILVSPMFGVFLIYMSKIT